ncbi:MAG: ribokinase [Deltaproteobacteria bacterium]
MAKLSEDALDVVVIGGANTDFLVRGQVLPKPGATVEGDVFQEAPGGKGANQAVAAARLGARVAFLGRVGSDARGRALLEQLRAEGVDVQAVSVDPAAPTGVALVMVDARGEKQILTAPGANHRLSADEILEASKLVARAKVVLLQLELSPAATDAAVHLARAAGARVVLDPAPPRALMEELLRDVHVMRANATEAEVLTGLPITDRSSARAAAENLLRRGVGAAIVGAPGGNWLASPEGGLWLPHLSVHPVDATGAGDAFAAALSVCLARGEELRVATRFASAAAALKTTKLGAQAGLPTNEEVVSLLQSTRHAGRAIQVD